MTERVQIEVRTPICPAPAIKRDRKAEGFKQEKVLLL